ncbi:hypothetical protein YSY22_43900 [Brevibacillus formosus]
MYLEYFQAQPDHVKDCDDLQFVPRLQAAFHHENLEEQAEQQQEVIPWQTMNGDEFGQGERTKNKDRKQARHGFLIAEMKQ